MTVIEIRYRQIFYFVWNLLFTTELMNQSRVVCAPSSIYLRLSTLINVLFIRVYIFSANS